jgi:hypothetical protein
MPKRVATPEGDVDVLTFEEFRERQCTAHARFSPGPVAGTFVCPQCQALICSKLSLHYSAHYPFDQSLLWLEEDDEVLHEHVLYCPNCDQSPEPVGVPIVRLGSYHHKPH